MSFGKQAETISRNFGVPVLLHFGHKPTESCCQAILRHFASLANPPTSLLVIGDRIGTDVILAHRLNRISSHQTLSILTTVTWSRPSPPLYLLRQAESAVMSLIRRFSKPPESVNWSDCTLEEVIPELKVPLIVRLRRHLTLPLEFWTPAWIGFHKPTWLNRLELIRTLGWPGSRLEGTSLEAYVVRMVTVSGALVGRLLVVPVVWWKRWQRRAFKM